MFVLTIVNLNHQNFQKLDKKIYTLLVDVSMAGVNNFDSCFVKLPDISILS